MKRMKYLLSGCLLFAVILLLVFFADQESRPLPSVSVLTEADAASIYTSASPCNASERMGHLMLDGLSAPYADGAYYISIDAEQDFLSRLRWSKPGYTVGLSPDFSRSSLAAGMAGNKAFELIVSNGETYFTEQLIFTKLPILSLSEDSTLAYKTGSSDASALFQLFSPDGLSLETISSYRLRGGSSLRHPKKPYRITLFSGRHKKESLPLLNMRASVDWILLPMYTDSSRMREKVALDLWNRVAASNPAHDIQGSEMEYVELVIDGAYQGIYGLVTPLDAQQCGIDSDPDARLFKVIEYMWDYVYENYQADPEALSEIIELKYPARGSGLWANMRRYVNACIVPDAEDAAALSELMDLDNLIDYGLFVNFLAANDNIFKNTYFVWTRGADGQYAFAKIPWDLNYSFGESHDSSSDLRTSFYRELADTTTLSNDLRVLLSSEACGADLTARMKARYSALRTDILNEAALVSRFRSEQALLITSGAFDREIVRWPESNPSSDLQDIEWFIRRRLKILDRDYDYAIRTEVDGDA